MIEVISFIATHVAVAQNDASSLYLFFLVS